MTVLLVWTTGLPCNQGIQLLVHHLVSTANVLSANLNLKKNTGNVYLSPKAVKGQNGSIIWIIK